MSRKIELLAPGGDVEAIKAAIVAGANAVYCGLDTFNARNRASNLSLDELNGVIRLAHEYGCEVFLTLNVVLLEHETKSITKLLNQLVNTKVDGIIVQDLGLFNLVKKHFPSLDVHASTQLTTHNEGQIKFLSKIGATRVNLSRELNLPEIKMLTEVAHDHDVLTEVFVHGALCIAFSGQCYSSSVSVGNSGNRGRCSQACRDEYEITNAGNKFPLNLKDNSAYYDLPELVDAKVDSLKVEGRIKGAHYVYTVVDTWRKQIDSFVESGLLIEDDSNLHKVFNRDFTNSFLKGNLTKDMFIDNPRDNSMNYAVEKATEQNNEISVVQIQEVTNELHQAKDVLGNEMRDKIEFLDIRKTPVALSFSVKVGQPFTVTVNTPKENFTLQSKSLLKAVEEKAITQELLEKRFKNVKSAVHTLESHDFSEVDAGLLIPLKEVSDLKDEIDFILNGSVEVIKHVEVPALPQHPKVNEKPTMSMLIADVEDLHLCDVTDADVYFKLPESFKKRCNKYIDILAANPRLIPWFPAVLIGKDYDEAVRILEEIKPARIVTNNTGIAYKAYEMGIEWVAGPFMNTTNSHALVTLKEELNCAGAFISNEINKGQIRHIRRPENFKLFYSIYHPILMMTSRQCFFQRTVGCNKPSIEAGCMLKCEKATTITNVKGISFAVDKQKGGYPSIYNHEQFLNHDAVTDFSGLFDEFFIDLTNIGAGSKEVKDKVELIKHFEALLNGVEGSQQNLEQMVEVRTNAQYVQGL
ncbi:peptidase U32 family protein [Vibrio sp. 10N.222.51.C8]|uniref:peptidase U32 family protein n=1 Tax=unclassified Vibrio TaxID=2614977 RepID=UPI0003096E8A|nr:MULTISPECIES: peptidase U32 family protein [unclassified Vibrio]ANP76594.1 peptidase U32 [Vibrio crassostreae 9CS106]PMI98613.1 peptidase U32 [Vibrio sp. 10N.286.45.E10]PMK19188.1 peptidase U32 [Vibrio sp. 10N.261.54.C3]PMO01641.1 peptidase U32 [Vibrio sp. 10N.222.55.F9]PMO12217.1 peptidase U32 [Vibrio sp. 10N.222.55.C12]